MSNEVNKIANYNQMMSWLTRPATPKTQVADLVDDLEPGSLKDELKKDFDPSQETHEEYLQRKNLDRPFNAQDGGRANLAIGGGQFEGTNLGTREGFARINEVKKIKEYKNIPGKYYVKNLPVVRDTPIEELENIPGYVRKTGDGVIFDNKTNATKFTKSKLVKNIFADRSITKQSDFQKQVSDLVDEGLETAEIAQRLKSSTSTVSATRKIIGKKGQGGKPQQNLFGVLNEDGQFEKFFKEYLEKKSKIEVAGRTRESKLWPVIKEALKNVPEDASLEEKFAAIRNFDKPSTEYGYLPSKGSDGKRRVKKMGDYLYSHLSNSFKDAQKGFGKISMKQLAEAVPAYSYETLLNIFGSSKNNPDLIKGDDKASRNKRANINNAKDVIKKLKEAGVVITQGEAGGVRGAKGSGSGKSYLFEELTDEVKTKLKDIKPYKESSKDFDQKELRRLVAIFSRASEDYNKFGFAQMGSTLDEAASALNTALINQFTSKKPDSRKNILSFDKVMTENDLTNLRNFINDTPAIKNILSITFDKSGKDGTYFKPRDLYKLSGGQLLKDLLIEKDHIFPVSEVSVLDRPTKTFIGRFGPGGALSESPYNKVLTTNHFNNSIRNNIQNFLNVNPDNQEAIKQINNTLQGLDTTIYHNGRYFGGKITPAISKQIEKMGYSKLDLQESVVNNIKGQESAIKKLKKQNYTDDAIKKAVSFSKFAFPFVLGAPIAYGIKKELDQGRNPLSMSAEASEINKELPQGSPGQLNPEDKSLLEEYPLTTGAAAAATPLATKTGRKVYGSLAKTLLKGFGSVPVSAYLSGKELASEDPNYAVAGADLLLPELGKRVAGSGTGIMSKIGRGLVNPFQVLEGLGKYGKLGRIAATGARIPSLMTPVGIGLQGVELVNQAMKEQKRIDNMRENDPEAYQKFIAEQEDMLRESAAYGGRIGFADGPEDPDKRKFMKIMGGLASLPILGRFFDVATQAPKVTEVVKRSAEGIPDFITDLIAKVKLKAETTGMKYFTGNSSDEFADVYKADDYTVTEQGNKITISKRKESGEMIEKDMEIELEMDPETRSINYKEASARPDAEGKLKDVDEYIDDIDLEDMRRYTYDE